MLYANESTTVAVIDTTKKGTTKTLSIFLILSNLDVSILTSGFDTFSFFGAALVLLAASGTIFLYVSLTVFTPIYFLCKRVMNLAPQISYVTYFSFFLICWLKLQSIIIPIVILSNLYEKLFLNKNHSPIKYFNVEQQININNIFIILWNLQNLALSFFLYM